MRSLQAYITKSSHSQHHASKVSHIMGSDCQLRTRNWVFGERFTYELSREDTGLTLLIPGLSLNLEGLQRGQMVSKRINQAHRRVKKKMRSL